MPLWSLKNPPKYLPNAIATKEGWVDPVTRELVVAIGALDTRHGGAEITRCRLINYKPTFSAGEILIFEMNFNEAVDFSGNGAPFLQIFVGDDPQTHTELQVPYVSGRGTGTWRFEKTVPLGVGGQITMPDPANLFIDGTLADVDGLGDAVDFLYTPPSPLPTVSIVYPQLNAPAFSSILSHAQFAQPATVPGRWVDFDLHFTWPILDITGYDATTYLVCRSNNVEFNARFSSWNDEILVFSFYLPNSDELNDVDGVECLSFHLGNAVLETVTGTYTDTVYDVSDVPIANPNVNIAVDPILVTDVAFDPMSITESDVLEITLTLEASISSVIDSNGVSLQYRSGLAGATCQYVSHTGSTITFTGPVSNNLFNNTLENPFYLFSLDIVPGSSIVTPAGTIMKSVSLVYFDVDTPPTINIP